ncbi:hypothetical protein N431DRAFT_437483 [Stipitochalara longipes BDJ]|nr:hypothetical protein N431DRAFT_437483 [Stipitochalara longipes BDJ]
MAPLPALQFPGSCWALQHQTVLALPIKLVLTVILDQLILRGVRYLGYLTSDVLFFSPRLPIVLCGFWVIHAFIECLVI